LVKIFTAQCWNSEEITIFVVSVAGLTRIRLDPNLAIFVNIFRGLFLKKEHLDLGSGFNTNIHIKDFLWTGSGEMIRCSQIANIIDNFLKYMDYYLWKSARKLWFKLKLGDWYILPGWLLLSQASWVLHASC
jgi:hypothetical protein